MFILTTAEYDTPEPPGRRPGHRRNRHADQQPDSQDLPGRCPFALELKKRDDRGNHTCDRA